jgi:hypothetical protein
MEDGSGQAWWNSPKTSKRLPSGLRVPTRSRLGEAKLSIEVDVREHLPYRFSRYSGVSIVRTRLDVGDYAIACDQGMAVVERKTCQDFATSIVSASLEYVMGELATISRGAVVVEAGYGDLLSVAHVAPGFIGNLVAILGIRYPNVTLAFANTRSLAEDWTYRWLSAASSELRSAGAHSVDSRAAGPGANDAVRGPKSKASPRADVDCLAGVT